MFIRTLWTLSVRTRLLLRRWMPTNILLDRLRARRRLKWGVPAMSLGVAYFVVAATFTTLIEHGWSEWLHVVVIVCVWNGLKFVLFGPMSIALLLRAWFRERQVRAAHRSEGVTRVGTSFQ